MREVKFTIYGDTKVSPGRPLGNINLPSHCRIVLISREEGVIIPAPSDTLMPRDMILVLLSEYSELEALSDVLGIPKEITGERNIKRIMIAGTSVIAIRLAKQVAKRYKDVEIYIAEPDKEKADMASTQLPEEVRLLVGSPTDEAELCVGGRVGLAPLGVGEGVLEFVLAGLQLQGAVQVVPVGRLVPVLGDLYGDADGLSIGVAEQGAARRDVERGIAAAVEGQGDRDGAAVVVVDHDAFAGDLGHDRVADRLGYWTA